MELFQIVDFCEAPCSVLIADKLGGVWELDTSKMQSEGNFGCFLESAHSTLQQTLPGRRLDNRSSISPPKLYS